MEIKVVCGANLGDEGKGLVSGCLAREASEKNHKVLTVFFNGTVQRGHSFGGRIHHCTAAGDDLGSDTFYHERFVVDPIALWVEKARVIIDPTCRVILPCDVAINRAKEIARGKDRHGSCGFGLFEAVKRSKNEEDAIHVGDFYFPFALYQKVKRIMEKYECQQDEVYNLDNWMKAVDWVVKNCKTSNFMSLMPHYDTIIFEAGQGLLLDQSYINRTKHLTPSSTGSYNIADFINFIGEPTDIYYVSRTYMTRHGAGMMCGLECKREDINPDIIDKTNMPNPWQGDLRFGYLNQMHLADRVAWDFNRYDNANAHLVYTQLNYTDNGIAAKPGIIEDVTKPEFITSVYGSDKEDFMERIIF